MKTHTRQLAVMMLIVLAATVTIVATKIQAQRDPAFDFSKLTTWKWNADGPGVVKVIVSERSNSEAVQKKYEPEIVKAVEEQFAARGYTPATIGTPDFVATYYLLITVGMSSQTMGQFLPSNAQWGIPLFAPATQSMTVYPQGTLVLDVSSPAASGMIWRGMAEAKIDLENSETKRVSRIRTIIKDLVAKFPRKAKK